MTLPSKSVRASAARVFAASALALLGCSPQVSLPDICESGRVSIRGVPNIAPQTLTETYSGPVDASKLDSAGGNVEMHASLRAVTLTPLSGIDSLDFIDAVSATVDPPADSGLPPMEIARYLKDPAQPLGSTLLIPGNGVDLIPYLRAGQLSTTTAFTGAPPPVDAVVGVRICVQATGIVHL